MRPTELRRHFLSAFWLELRVVWPILSGLIAIQLALGLLVGYREGWAISDAAYYLGTRLIAIIIGLSGILLTGLVAAVGVRALMKATEHEAK
jgi:hypothetical protein